MMPAHGPHLYLYSAERRRADQSGEPNARRVGSEPADQSGGALGVARRRPAASRTLQIQVSVRTDSTVRRRPSSEQLRDHGPYQADRQEVYRRQGSA